MEEVHTADIFGGLGKSGEQKKKKDVRLEGNLNQLVPVLIDSAGVLSCKLDELTMLRMSENASVLHY